jgi:ferrochelatase
MTKAVLLVNLGSPDSPAVPDVRRYLREFLMDPRVLDINPVSRFCIVNFFILPTRPQKSAEAYQAIWTGKESPLVSTSRNVQKLLQAQVNVPVHLAMRYQNPSIPDAIKKIRAEGVTDLFLVPLFPHYAMSSFESAVERVKEVARSVAPRMNIRVQPPYYNHPDYIEAMAEVAKPFISADFDHLLFSFHGVPERQIRKSDPTGSHCLSVPNCCEQSSPAHATCYRAQCFATVQAFVRKTGLKPSQYSVSFQSRLGRTPWLRPFTDEVIPQLARQGVKKLLVTCPSFVSDCLETTEEIGIRGRELFIEAGGKYFDLIPCLNGHPLWIKTLQNMVEGFVPGKPY